MPSRHVLKGCHHGEIVICLTWGWFEFRNVSHRISRPLPRNIFLILSISLEPIVARGVYTDVANEIGLFMKCNERTEPPSNRSERISGSVYRSAMLA
jgi:hypothetical protein